MREGRRDGLLKEPTSLSVSDSLEVVPQCLVHGRLTGRGVICDAQVVLVEQCSWKSPMRRGMGIGGHRHRVVPNDDVGRHP